MIEGSVRDAQIPLINVHADVSSGGGRLMFGVSLHLHLYMYICERQSLWQVCAYAQTRLSFVY